MGLSLSGAHEPKAQAESVFSRKHETWGLMSKKEQRSLREGAEKTKYGTVTRCVQLQIEDISRRLKSGDLGIPKNPEDRSPSPEPIYSSEGKRLNTREYRTRKKMEDERHTLVQQLTELNPDYKPPTDYKPPQNRVTDKVFIPQENHPDINFVGLLIGPRGNTLKALEKETGAKIIIRGKGSVKEGKVGRRDGLPLPGEDEPLHAFVSAPVAEAVQKAVRRINEIIRQGIEVPESQNDLRRAQLRELALLNGTLREHEGLMKLRAMAEAQSIATNKIQCGICGGAGHLSTDCKVNLSGMAYADQLNTNPSERAKMDSEYSALMAELGVGAGSMLPGMAPSEEDDEDVSTSAVNGTSNTTVTSTQNAMPSNQPYPYGLPPPPPLPGSQYPPMMHWRLHHTDYIQRNWNVSNTMAFKSNSRGLGRCTIHGIWRSSAVDLVRFPPDSTVANSNSTPDLPSSTRRSLSSAATECDGVVQRQLVGLNCMYCQTKEAISAFMDDVSHMPNAGKKTHKKEHNSYIPNKRVREREYVRVREYSCLKLVIGGTLSNLVQC
ncbi:splicing factor 1 [Clonorchis sinensis]|uniref:Branchpoint-bridging protein n=1 Tax=Clonorchis sinensis TaxID=79923 RepID=G7YH89_CLOSI|nr:splicing factor 1 [Clonorchis sinensis]